MKTGSAISTQQIRQVLNHCLLIYRTEITAGEQLYKESQRHTTKAYSREALAADRLYWESALDTVREVAAALGIGLEESEPAEQRCGGEYGSLSMTTTEDYSLDTAEVVLHPET